MLLSVTVCAPSLTAVNVTWPLESIAVHVPESSVKQYSPAAAVTKEPVPRSTSFVTVIFGSSMTWFAGTGTFCCPVSSTPVSGLRRLCCDEPLQSPAWFESLSW